MFAGDNALCASGQATHDDRFIADTSQIVHGMIDIRVGMGNTGPWLHMITTPTIGRIPHAGVVDNPCHANQHRANPLGIGAIGGPL